MVTGVTDDHLLEAGPCRSSFARAQLLWMIVCKRPDPLDDNLQHQKQQQQGEGGGGKRGIEGKGGGGKEEKEEEKFLRTDGQAGGWTKQR